MDLIVKTNQGAFDRACRRLFNGKGRAYENGSCVYRAADGNKCVIGDMLPNKYYYPEMEGKSWSGLRSIYDGNISSDLLGDLQDTHDGGEYWTRNTMNELGIQKLFKIAQKFGLNTKELERLTK